ncbi:MAG TPA: DNA-directed RNA polymerase subunit beta [Candidatus Sumerlaeia bacterium]|nr:DNA-directed RNA polymerase subunit beta [Candidatus Sumerlaeia bacterium]
MEKYEIDPITGRIAYRLVPEIMEIPYLLETQKKSYSDFLQFQIPPSSREVYGLQEAFLSVFPIRATNNPSTLEFVEYSFGKPKYTESECIDRGMTYAAPLKVKLQLIVREENPETRQVDIKDIKEQDTYMGEIPLMTAHGTFIINGAERVIVSQLHRSPGVSFSSAIHPNGKTTYSARIIPYRGAWVEFEIDIYNVMYVMIDRKRRIPATTFLRTFGYESEEDIAREFFPTEKLTLDDFKKGKTKIGNMISNLHDYLGTEFIEPVLDPKTKKVLIEANTKVTKKAIEILKSSGVRSVSLTVADGYQEILGAILAADVIDTHTGEILGECWDRVTTTLLKNCASAGIKKIEVLKISHDDTNVILNTLEKDKVHSYEESLIEFFKKLRPGNPVSVLAGRRLMEEMFFNERRYDLGPVGRHKINTRFKMDTTNISRLLSRQDIVQVMKYLVRLQKDQVDVDDIDHLGNRRVRSVGELLENQIRIGLADLEKTARERMAIVDLENMLPQNLINAKPVITAIKDFFGRSQLSQFMDQTNPLAELTHKRRLSALGPGGLSRDRAGFEVRDIHHTHYGRVCPIETPEGPNIGLISSLSTYARINQYGFIETPYRKVFNGTVTNDIEYMTADVEDEYCIAQANAALDENSRFTSDAVLCRYRGDFPRVPPSDVEYMDVSPKQLVSVSAAMIPFLEHDDANRALMGSNMQRQAVPLLFPEAPIVGTGMERKVAVDSGVCVVATQAGTVDRVSAHEIVIINKKNEPVYYPLTKFKRSNQNTCLNQRPLVNEGDTVVAGQIIADGPATDKGEIALGRNIICAFMPWGGYNFEDAILISEKMVYGDAFTSIHIMEFEIDARDTKMGKEEITRDIPNVGEEALHNLNDNGLIKIGSEVKPGDILVGKVTPKAETDLTSEEKLLRAIFGEKAGDVRDASLKVPPGAHGIVIDVKVFSRKERGPQTDRDDKAAILRIEKERDNKLAEIWARFDAELTEIINSMKPKIVNFETGEVEYSPGAPVTQSVLDYVRQCLKTGMLPVDGRAGARIKSMFHEIMTAVNDAEEDASNYISRVKTGDELPPGVNKVVKVYIATKRKIAVGDKMAGRHGNKGVIAKILPVHDMPFLEDGTPVDIVLNPLSVPSRMNIGQILETHLGWAAKALGLKIATPIFDGATEILVRDLLQKAKVNETGQTILYDGLTGEPFDRPVTVGYIYMMKLAHLVEDKMHARAIRPYSLVTQQPLGGKAQFGGQRFGEMEVWALEAYGAAYTLQELLTVKSDDVNGRTRIYESIVKGRNSLSPGIPESFNVLVKELQGLGLNMELMAQQELEQEPMDEEIEEEEEPIDLLSDDDEDE